MVETEEQKAMLNNGQKVQQTIWGAAGSSSFSFPLRELPLLTSKERYLVKGGGGKPEREGERESQGRGPGKPTQADMGELQRLLGKQPPDSSKGVREGRGPRDTENSSTVRKHPVTSTSSC